MAEEILVARDGVVATVTLNNPAKLNAVNASMWRRLRTVMEELSADDSLRCVVLRGAGEKAFAAGGDIEEFLTLRDTLERAQVYHEEWVAQARNAVRDCRHPTVALIQGACIGGGLEIAGQCDLRICGRSARFGADQPARLLDGTGRADRPAGAGRPGAGAGDPAGRPHPRRQRGL